jgi:hypothetical protein
MRYKNLSVIDDGIDKCSEFIENSRNILDDCVYGMNDAKSRFFKPWGSGFPTPPLCSVRSGYTDRLALLKPRLLKKRISKILGRVCVYFLGGAGIPVLDGHSYTYEGSRGKIIQILIDSKCMNPVIYFDELDKVSDTPRVRRSSTSMHIIDTTQNSQFHDKYFRRLILILASVFLFSVITTRAR